MKNASATLQLNLGLFLTALSCHVALGSTPIQPAKSYDTGFAQLTRLAGDLHRALEPKQQQKVAAAPVLLDQVHTPYLQATKNPAGLGTVQMSAGFIDLMNHLSHAMAIDGNQKGFLRQYLGNLATDDATAATRPVSHQQAWSFDVINAQVSQFNQMAAGLVAINMAQHYLGYHQKYAARLDDKQLTSLNNFLSPDEWRKSVLRGAHNGLQCGLGVEGLKYLFDAVASMPTRPEWSYCILPKNANVAKIKKDLDKLEEYFFAGRNFLD